jgi:hypothetical protein
VTIRQNHDFAVNYVFRCERSRGLPARVQIQIIVLAVERGLKARGYVLSDIDSFRGH